MVKVLVELLEEQSKKLEQQKLLVRGFLRRAHVETNKTNTKQTQTQTQTQNKHKQTQTQTQTHQAIGQRNKVASEIETRESRRLDLKALADQRQLELDRQQALYESLLRVEQEQRATIERLMKQD